MPAQTFKSYVNINKETIIWQSWIPNRANELLYIEKAGISEPDPKYTIFRTAEKADFYVIEYVSEGKGHIEAGGKFREVSAGDVYIVHQKTQHLYYADKDDPFRKKWLNVSGRFLSSVINGFSIDSPFFVINLGADAEKIFDEIHQKASSTTPADVEELTNFTMKRLLDLFLMIDKKRRTDEDTLSLEEQIVRYIEANICLDINITSLSETFFISSSTLYRIFKKLYGISPKDFILSKKIEFAKRMISMGDANVQMVSSTLNFYDSHHFQRTFKKYTGMTPSEYKKQIKDSVEQ
jgi:AraC-like DNA-binding protein